MALRAVNGLRVIEVPGVYSPANDSLLLAEALAAERVKGAAVLDLCTGSGFLAMTAKRLGAGSVMAVDISRRAVASSKLNMALNGMRVRVRCGDLFTALPERTRYDIIVTNPPWLPTGGDRLPSRGDSRAWDAGLDGRVLLDSICAGAFDRLRPGGVLLTVHGAVCGTEGTAKLLASEGLAVTVPMRRVMPMTPLLRERARTMVGIGPWGPTEGTCEMVIVRGERLRSK
jgi:release factor glutamine methyltransferase